MKTTSILISPIKLYEMMTFCDLRRMVEDEVKEEELKLLGRCGIYLSVIYMA